MIIGQTKKERFEYSFKAYIDLTQKYFQIEKALYGNIYNDGILADSLHTIQEVLLETYLDYLYLNDYVVEACWDYLSLCEDDKEKFDINKLNEVITNALDEEAEEALAGLY